MADSELMVLSAGVGYGIVVGIGAFFALMMYVQLSLHQIPSATIRH